MKAKRGIRKNFLWLAACNAMPRRGGQVQYDYSQVAPRTKRAPALVVFKVFAGRPGALFKHFARDEVRSHWSARGNSGLGSLEGFVVVGRPVSRERRGVRLGVNAIWMPKY
jgi:hypothetical protein